MQGLKDIEFREGEFTVRTLREEELRSSYRFRHRVFAEQLKWVPASPDGEEVGRQEAPRRGSRRQAATRTRR